MSMNTSVQTREPLLDRSDRCDQCAASAMVRITTENLGVWKFCGHHADMNRDVIPGIVSVHDERQPLPPPAPRTEGSPE